MSESNNPFRFPLLPKLFNLEEVKETYGSLDALEGTWVGDQGWNIVTVPIPGSADNLGFKVLIRPYIELMKFDKINGAVPNRGKDIVQNNYALKYELQVNDLQTKEGMHAETGLFLNQSNGLLIGEKPIVRQSAIPHGNTVTAIGTGETFDGNPIPKVKANLNKTFSPMPKIIKGVKTRYGYPETFKSKAAAAMKEIPARLKGSFDPLNPINALISDTRKQKIKSSIVIDTDTANGGAVTNTPFIKSNANTPNFRSILWIQEVETESGKVFMQLQYAQVTEIVFPVSGPDIVNWPHININTLVKI